MGVESTPPPLERRTGESLHAVTQSAQLEYSQSKAVTNPCIPTLSKQVSQAISGESSRQLCRDHRKNKNYRFTFSIYCTRAFTFFGAQKPSIWYFLNGAYCRIHGPFAMRALHAFFWQRTFFQASRKESPPHSNGLHNKPRGGQRQTSSPIIMVFLIGLSCNVGACCQGEIKL